MTDLHPLAAEDAPVVAATGQATARRTDGSGDPACVLHGGGRCAGR
jgi:hypothetical protein